jgi:predicted site-specific integrase-resolvase
MDREKYLRPQEVANFYKISVNTLINWEKEGKITAVRTRGGHRRYLKSEIFPEEDDCQGKRRICYCRVSSPSQREDLQRQVEFFQQEYPDYEIIKDIGSGLNSKRKGFNTILDAGIKGNIGEIVVTHRDRLCRVNFDLIEGIIQKYSQGKIVVLDKKETSPEEELVGDLLSIITVFSGRLHGLRSHSLKRKIKAESTKNTQDEDFPKPTKCGNTSVDV